MRLFLEFMHQGNTVLKKVQNFDFVKLPHVDFTIAMKFINFLFFNGYIFYIGYQS